MSMFQERRESVRVSVQGTLTVETATPGPALRLTDVGTGGFAVRSSAPLPLDIVTSYRFATADRKWSVFMQARAIYCKLVPARGDVAPEYATGLAFVDTDSPSVQRDLMAMIEHAMNVVSSS
jgi:c-di-GMP-binding flagellar brake protein YcgR